MTLLIFVIMSKVKLTKGELKQQRDTLKQFKRYLPTLQLKKQQLQMKINESRHLYEDLQHDAESKVQTINQWVGVLADSDIDLKQWALPSTIKIEKNNIAGTVVPVVSDVAFTEPDYDYYETPLWVDKAIAHLREYFKNMVELQILAEQIKRLEKELQTTSQRVNLFEKVKIPECQENIRRIRIYLGDQQANAVGISKVAKKKLEAAAV